MINRRISHLSIFRYQVSYSLLTKTVKGTWNVKTTDMITYGIGNSYANVIGNEFHGIPSKILSIFTAPSRSIQKCTRSLKTRNLPRRLNTGSFSNLDELTVFKNRPRHLLSSVGCHRPAPLLWKLIRLDRIKAQMQGEFKGEKHGLH